MKSYPRELNMPKGGKFEKSAQVPFVMEFGTFVPELRSRVGITYDSGRQTCPIVGVGHNRPEPLGMNLISERAPGSSAEVRVILR